MSRLSGKNTPARVLIIRPSALGDVCRTVPVLVSLARAWPDATIGWVVQEGFEDAIRCHPDLDEVVSFPRRAFTRWAVNPRVTGRALSWLVGLRRGRWDCVIDCQGLIRSGLMTFSTGAPWRVGDRRGREGSWLACNRRVDTGGICHTVDRMLALLAAVEVPVIKDMRLYAPPASTDWWSRYRQKEGLSGDLIAVASTTRWPSKAWPEDCWVQWATVMAETCPGGFVLLGSAAEAPQVETLAHRLRSVVSVPVTMLAGQTTVGGLMAVIESARLTVANDSAALHLAVGLGGRCVGLFGPTAVDAVGPYQLTHQTVSGPAEPGVNYRDAKLGDRLMRGISVEAVVARCQEVIAATTAPAGAGERA